MRISSGLMLALMAAASPGRAEVVSADANGFAVTAKAVIAAPPERVWAALVEPGRWWNPAHSYSGDGANLTLDPVAGGCFCEKLPKEGGSVEHMRVVLAMPGSLLRLSGGLGPLQGEGVAGALSWELKPVAGGTEISQTYVVGGHMRGGLAAIAPIVDRVLGEQFGRLKAAAEKR